MKKLNLILVFICFGCLFLQSSNFLFAQNCQQNNLNIQSFEFRDSNGLPFDPNSTEYERGDIVQGQIFVTFGGSSTNAHNLRFLYNVYINGSLESSGIDVCLFIGVPVPKNTPQFITNFTWLWGDIIEFRDIFMRWHVNSNESSCPTVAGSNAQCYTDEIGLTVNTPFIPLPVLWHDLSAISTHDQKRVEIKWSTQKEWDSSHFEIERSLNNADHFELIGAIDASTFSFEIKNYKFNDNNIPNNISRVYYRLKQVDLDGIFEYSKVLMVNVNTLQDGVATWQFYPNPFIGNELKISLQNPKVYKGEQIHVKMISNLGVTVQLLPDCLDPYEIDIGAMTKNIPKGILLVELSWGNQVEIFKVIKQ